MDPTAPKSNNPTDGNSAPPTPGSPVYNPNLEPLKPNISATALDPNDPLIGQNQQAGPQSTSPIQAGQYVVAGGDTSQPVPPPPGINNFAAPAPNINQPPPGPFLATAQDQSSLPPLGQNPPDQPPSGLPPSAQAPDPTPYAPPPPTPGSQQVASGGGGSIIKKLRLVAILLGVLVLVAAIGALVWFFFLNKTNQEPVSTIDNNQDTISLPPSPPPQRSNGGFGTLPQIPESTNSAPQSTASGQLQN